MYPGTPTHTFAQTQNPYVLAKSDEDGGGDGSRTRAAVDILGAIGQTGGALLGGAADLVGAYRRPATTTVVAPPPAAPPPSSGPSLGLLLGLGALGGTVVALLLRR